MVEANTTSFNLRSRNNLSSSLWLHGQAQLRKFEVAAVQSNFIHLLLLSHRSCIRLILRDLMSPQAHLSKRRLQVEAKRIST